MVFWMTTPTNKHTCYSTLHFNKNIKHSLCSGCKPTGNIPVISLPEFYGGSRSLVWTRLNQNGPASRWSSIIIPPATKLGGGGILESPCPSVRPSVRLSVCPVAFWFPAHNCFPFTPIIMKLHMQTPHEARMCPIDFEVKRSKIKVTMPKLLKMVSGA